MKNINTLSSMIQFTRRSVALVLLATASICVWGDDYSDTYNNPTGTNTPARANGMGAFSTIGDVTGNVGFGNSSLQINSNAGSGTFTVSSTDGSYIESIEFTQNASYPVNTLTSSQGTVTGPSSNVFTFTPNTTKLTSATFSMSAKSGKKVRLAPIVVNLTSNSEYFSKDFTISSSTVSCTKSNASSDITITSTGGTSNKGLTLANTKALTIASSGHNIKAIHFTCESHNTMSNLSANTGTYGSNSWTAGTATQSVTFTSSGSNATIVGISVELAASCSTPITPSLSYTPAAILVSETASPTVTGNTGSGAVTYEITSATPSGCATINPSTGVVTGVAEGSVTVKATVAASGDYCSGTATATVTITDVYYPPSASPTIITHPVSASYEAGDPIAALTVVATGSGTLSYQWKKDGVNISGAESASYTPTASGSYTCVVTNTETGHKPASVTSNAATIVIKTNDYLLQGISGTSGTGTLTGDFYTDAPLTMDATVSYDGVSYNKAVKFDGNVTIWSSYSARTVRYDCKTTETEFTIIVYNKNSSAKNIYIGDIKESAIGSANAVSSYQSYSVAGNSQLNQSYTISHDKPASLFVSVEDRNNLEVAQIIAKEKGTPLPAPGSVGYKLNFKKARPAIRSGSEVWLDDEDFKFLPSSNVTAGSSEYIAISSKGTNYIQFRTDKQATVKIGIGSNIGNGFFVSDDKNGLVNPIEFPKSGGANKMYSALVKAGTHYIVPNGSNVYVTSLELAAAVTIRYNANGGLGTMKPQIVSPGEVTLDECTYLRPGYVLAGWSRNADGSGTITPNGGTLTVAESPDEITLYAVWLDACAATPTLNKISPVVNLKDDKKVDMPVINLVCNYDTTDVHYSIVSALPAIPGCTFSFYESQVHIAGTPIIGNTAVENRTVTITLSNDCSPATTYTVTQDIRITPKTARPKVAFIITGTKGGAFTAYNSSEASACNTLVTYLRTFYDVDFVNGYATKDEAAIATFYNDYDVMVVTDYLETPEGYTNALGTLIDKKPILCFEAYVAGENGKNWHINSTPADPSPKTGTMKVTCAGHKIFSEDEGPIFNRPGGESDTTITVLASIGGKGLQGFVINEAPDFVFLGTVRDESNNRDLIVCCERQVVFQARLMMYCINFNDMNRLSTAGQIVMHQMIEYLLSTDETKAADCSLVFDNGVGNTSFNPGTYTGTGTPGDGKWSTAANWAPGYNVLPSPYEGARITAECHVDIPNAHAGNVKLNMGKDEHDNPVQGKLVIEPQGGLLVAGMVKKVNDTRYASPLVTKAEDVLIKADENHNGALVFGNKESDVYATVQYYSRAYGATAGNPVWQYIGIPLQAGRPAIELYPQAWMCRWSTESDGTLGGQWQWVNKYDILLPFESYCITQDEKKTYTFVGKLNEPLDRTILLTEYDADGFAFVANSWVAPIKIQEMADEDFTNADKSIYIYHSGSYADWKAYHDAGTDVVSSKEALASPGQYAVIPIHSSPYLTGADSVIPAMQGFFVKTTSAGASLKLDYSRVVYDSKNFTVSTQPMRSPGRVKATPEVMRIIVYGENGADQVYLLQREDFSEGYEDGWDGRKLEGDENVPQLAILKEDEEMSVAALPEIEGRYLNFRAGKDSKYTFKFDYSGETMYLYDVLEAKATAINTETTYEFTASNKTNIPRFMITSHPPRIPTGIETTDEQILKDNGALKFVYDGAVYVLRNGRIYDVRGQRVSLNDRKEGAQ